MNNVESPQERRWDLLLRRAMIGLLASWLVACGGGGSAETPPPAVAASNVRLAASVPQAALLQVTEVVSPTAMAAFGEPVALTRPAAGEEHPVLALDRGGHIVLAALSTGTQVELDADSTALALVRLAFGARPADRSASAFNAEVRASPGFTALAAAVQRALASGQPPSLNPEVLRGVMSVQSRMGSQAVARASARKKALATLPSPRVEDVDRQPYSLMPDLWAGSVFISNPELSKSQVELVNATPLYWSVTVRDLQGRTFPTGRAADDAELLDPMSLEDRLLGNLDGRTGSILVDWLVRMGPERLKVPAGQAFQLTLAYDRVALHANLLNLLVEAVQLGFPLEEPLSCREAVAQVLWKSDGQGLLVSPTRENLLKYVEDFFTVGFWSNYLNPTEASALRSKCFPGSVVDSARKFLVARLQFLVPLAGQLDAASKAVSMVSLVDRTVWTLTAVGKSRTVGVCTDGARIVNCTARFVFEPSLVLLAPGAEYTARYSALDRRGLFTAAPAGRSLSLLPAVPGFDASTGTFHASGFVSDLVLQVDDPATGATGSVRIDVVPASIEPPFATLDVGQRTHFALRDTLGRLVRHPQSASWSFVPDGVAVLEMPTGELAGRHPDAVQIRAVRPGRAELTLTNAADPRGLPLRAQVTVRAGAPNGHLASGPNPSALDATVRFIIELSPALDGPGVPRPTGEVRLREQGGASLCSITLSTGGTGQCDVPLGGPPRTLDVVADYDGDSIFQARAAVASALHSVGLLVPRVELLPPGTVRMGDVFTLSAVVRAGVDAPAGLAVPGGEVELALGLQRCRALLFAEADGSAVGRCLVQAVEAGPQVPMQAAYSGDPVFAATTTAGSLAVGRGLAVVQAQATPTTVSDGGRVDWTFSVSLPSVPTVAATGRVTVRTAPDAAPPAQLLCEADLDGTGAGSCGAALPVGPFAPGPLAVVVGYSGDERLLPTDTTVVLDRVTSAPEPGPWFTTERSTCLSDGSFGGCSVYGRAIDAYIRCETRHFCLDGAVLHVLEETVTWVNGVRTTGSNRSEVDAGQLAYTVRDLYDTTPGVGTYAMPLQPLVRERAHLVYTTSHRGGFSAYPIDITNGRPGYEASAVTLEIRNARGELLWTRSVDARRRIVQDCGLFTGGLGGPGELCVQALPYP